MATTTSTPGPKTNRIGLAVLMNTNDPTVGLRRIDATTFVLPVQGVPDGIRLTISPEGWSGTPERV